MAFCHKSGIICISEVIDISPNSLDSSLYFIQPSISHGVLWPPHAKSWLIGKDSDAVRDWGQEEKGTTEDEMAGWHHWLDGRESEWTPGDGDGQGGLVCCDSCSRKESTHDWETELNCAYKLNKQGDNIQPWCTPFPIWNQCVVPCLILPIASWPAYIFLKRQVRWSSIPVSFRMFHSFQYYISWILSLMTEI